MNKSAIDEPYTYLGDAAVVGSQGHIYVVEFSGAGIKVGVTANPTRRIRSHERDGRTFSRPVIHRWVSTPHVEARANEQRLIGHCCGTPDQLLPSARTEYFHHSYDDAVRFAESLPMSLGGVAESAGLSAAIGHTIRVRRTRLGLTQAEFGAEVDWSRTTIGAIEAGGRNMAVNDLPKICRALGLTILDLLHQVHADDAASLGLRQSA